MKIDKLLLTQDLVLKDGTILPNGTDVLMHFTPVTEGNKLSVKIKKQFKESIDIDQLNHWIPLSVILVPSSEDSNYVPDIIPIWLDQ